MSHQERPCVIFEDVEVPIEGIPRNGNVFNLTYIQVKVIYSLCHVIEINT